MGRKRIEQPKKPCRVCGKLFPKPVHKSHVAWEGMHCCSKSCGGTRQNPDGGYTPKVKYCDNRLCRQPFIKARKNTHEFFSRQRFCSIACGKVGLTNEKSSSWVGDDVGYQGLHLWMRKTYGKPSHCDFSVEHSGRRMYHWANKSGKYLRERSDWLRLCVPCHRKYDLQKSREL